MKKFIAILILTFSFSALANSNYKCFGTEPFWGMELVNNSLTLDLFDEEKITEEVLSRDTAAGLATEFAFIAKTNKSSATIVTGECSDGMSDRIYSHHVVYTDGKVVLYGCCDRSSK